MRSTMWSWPTMTFLTSARCSGSAAASSTSVAVVMVGVPSLSLVSLSVVCRVGRVPTLRDHLYPFVRDTCARAMIGSAGGLAGRGVGRPVLARS